MKTSARNNFTGKVTRIVKDELLAEVEITTGSGLKIVSIITAESYKNMNISEGCDLSASIKAPWVIVGLDDSAAKTSARNRFSGKIVSLKHNEISAEVLIDLPDGSSVCALITRGSSDSLGLAEGMQVTVMFKAFAVVLNGM